MRGSRQSRINGTSVINAASTRKPVASSQVPASLASAPAGKPRKVELHKTEADIALGERHISSQRARIARLEQKGADAALAKELLNTFLQIQQLHQYRRNQLERELAWSP